MMFEKKPTGMCPACEESPLIILELGGVEIDYCTSCRGVWLDAGELEIIAQAAGAEPGPLAQALESARGETRGDRRCPRCARPLRVVILDDDAHTELDRCPRGHGFWFDAGEMEKVVAGHRGGEEEAVGSFFRNVFGARLKDGSTPDA